MIRRRTIIYEWDSNLSKDSDNNGNPVDDIDYTESIITLPTTESGLISGD